jgi:hypothetical protein
LTYFGELYNFSNYLAINRSAEKCILAAIHSQLL